MQAIARVNRVYKDKIGGLVVDYLGIASDLKEALSFYSDAGGRGDPAEVQELYNYLINYDLCNVIDIPLTYYKDLILYNTDKIAGYEFSGVPAFFDVSGLQPAA